MATAANAEGGWISMVLAPPYTPTAANPDPESGTFEDHTPVQVGPYVGHAGTWTTFAKPSGTASEQAGLYVQIPLADGQAQDLVVSANDLSTSQLVALVGSGLTDATGTSGS
jgi:hypothetical protein